MNQAISFEELDNQTAFELPAREMPLVTVVITHLVRDIEVDINVEDVNVAAQICAAVLSSGKFSCEVVVD